MSSPPYTLLEPDTRNPAAVAAAIQALHGGMFPGEDCAYIAPAIARVAKIFSKGYPGYSPMDTAYHDLEHTLQATLCCMRILAGRKEAGLKPALTPRDFRIAYHAMLLHDAGYAKDAGDTAGTGAKHTPVHEERGCDIARRFLAEDNWPAEDIERVCSLILCTGPRSNVRGTKFGNSAHRFTAQAVCTADFLSQMSDPGYVQKLPDLFAEFSENYRANHLPDAQRLFKSVDDLYRNTPAFWEQFVVAKLRDECEEVSRYLARPFPDGPNPYLLQVKENIAAVRRIVALSDGELSTMAKMMG